RLLAQAVPGRGGRGRSLSAPRPHHGMGHRRRPCGADRRRRPRANPGGGAAALRQAGAGQPPLRRQRTGLSPGVPMTTAHLVLASIALLLALLAHGRVGPAVLFAAWAGGYHLLGLASQQELLASFSNPALATLILLLLVSLAIERSPLLDQLSDALLKGRTGPATIRLSSFACLASAFLHNTAVLGALLGTVARQRRHPASKLLIPLSYASILGGVTTLVGTSTNLVVNSFVVDAGLPPLHMFQFTWVGLPVAVACIAVMALSARLLPANASSESEARSTYFLEARVAEGSPMIGR